MFENTNVSIAGFRRIGMLLLPVLLSGFSISITGCSVEAPGPAFADRHIQGPGVASRQLPVRRPAFPAVPAGTTLPVRLLRGISSRSSGPGEEFEAELASAIIVSGQIAFPKSSRVRGHVQYAKSSGKDGQPGYLQITLDSIQAIDGRWIGIDTTLISARGKTPAVDAEAAMDTRRKLVFAMLRQVDERK